MVPEMSNCQGCTFCRQSEFSRVLARVSGHAGRQIDVVGAIIAALKLAEAKPRLVDSGQGVRT